MEASHASIPCSISNRNHTFIDMANTSPVALILGSGQNVGLSVAKALSAKGYKIATVSRTAKSYEGEPDQAKFEADLTQPSSIADVFAKVGATVGIPSVVIYNGKLEHPEPALAVHMLTNFKAAKGTKNEGCDPLAVPLSDFISDLNVNTTSVFAAAQESVKAFQRLPDTASRTFIFTGNCLNTTTMARIFTGGVGKSASAHLIQSAAAAYADQGFK